MSFPKGGPACIGHWTSCCMVDPSCRHVSRCCARCLQVVLSSLQFVLLHRSHCIYVYHTFELQGQAALCCSFGTPYQNLTPDMPILRPHLFGSYPAYHDLERRKLLMLVSPYAGLGGAYCGHCCEVRLGRWPTGGHGLTCPSSLLRCCSCTSSP